LDDLIQVKTGGSSKERYSSKKECFASDDEDDDCDGFEIQLEREEEEEFIWGKFLEKRSPRWRIMRRNIKEDVTFRNTD
jgi:hypothetical protein